MDALGYLIRQCNEFGTVSLRTSNSILFKKQNKTYWFCSIEFETNNGFKVTAESQYAVHQTPEAACEDALNKAKELQAGLTTDNRIIKR